ncbi:MAG: nucleotidyl transferase AbiEii/AbiGii toxin family protein [Thermoproteota archaeon]
MIDRETLVRIARVTGLKPFQQEKNYVQTILLRIIYSRVSREMVFKGGTALAFFHGLNRFSEDMDFTLKEHFDLRRLVAEIREDLEILNMNASLRIIEDNPHSFSFRVGVEGPLFTQEIERCFVRVEVSRRERILREVEVKELRTVYPDILPFHVAVMSPEEILAEKVRALTRRGKPRDLYDLWFLLKTGVKPDIHLINEKLSYYRKEFNPRELMVNVERIRAVWRRELEPVIIGSLPDFEAIEKDLKPFFSEAG